VTGFEPTCTTYVYSTIRPALSCDAPPLPPPPPPVGKPGRGPPPAPAAPPLTAAEQLCQDKATSPGR